MPGGLGGDFSVLVRADERGRGLPETPSELFAYDAIILSNVPREALSDQALAWIDEWIGRRGGGLCMAGGPNSFSSGSWADTSVGRMLPLELPANGRDWEEVLTSIRPAAQGALHPIWHIEADDARNRAALKTLPDFFGRNREDQVKPTADVLAYASAGSGAAQRQPGGGDRRAAKLDAAAR